jgi:putative transposase
MIEPGHPTISMRRQCELIGLGRSSLYYQPTSETAFNLKLMRLIDQQYLKTPYYGYPKMTAHLRRAGHQVNPKRIRRLTLAPALQVQVCAKWA